MQCFVRAFAMLNCFASAHRWCLFALANCSLRFDSDTYNPCPGVMDGVPSAKDYEGGFGTSLMIKDIKLALESAGASDDKDGKGALPMGSRALELYEAMATENAHKDFGGIYKYVYDGKPCRT